MSTELKKYASVMPATSTMSLTRFSGGSAGMKLQITIQNGVTQYGTTSTTLSRAQVKNLVKTLQEAFELTDEPNDDQDEETLSYCCGSEPSWADESLCGQCLEYTGFI